MPQHPRPVGPTTVNAAAPFSIEMITATRPERPRLFLAPRLPLPWAQTTHVPAPITVDMLAGYHPDTNRAFRPPKIGLSDSQTTHAPAAFQQSMVEATRPFGHRMMISPNLEFWADDASVLVPTVVFAFESTWGSTPDRPRLFKVKLGWVDSQTTHVQAPITVDMLAGALPSSPRLPRNTKTGTIDLPNVTLVVMTPEMFAGWHPDSPVLGKPKPLGWTTSQTTHVPAPFMQAMVSATRPDLPNLKKPLPQGWSVSQLTFTAGVPLSLSPDEFFVVPVEDRFAVVSGTGRWFTVAAGTLFRVSGQTYPAPATLGTFDAIFDPAVFGNVVEPHVSNRVFMVDAEGRLFEVFE